MRPAPLETPRPRLCAPRIEAEAGGLGLAREAAFAVGSLGWLTVVSYIDPASTRSVRLAERPGTRLEPEPADGLRVYRHVAEGNA